MDTLQAFNQAATILAESPWKLPYYHEQATSRAERILGLGANGCPRVLGGRLYAPAQVRNWLDEVDQSARLVTITLQDGPFGPITSVVHGFLVETWVGGERIPEAVFRDGFGSKEEAERALIEVAHQRYLNRVAGAIIRADRVENGARATEWVPITSLKQFVRDYSPGIAENFDDEKLIPNFDYFARVEMINGEQVVQTMGRNVEPDTPDNAPLQEEGLPWSYWVEFKSKAHAESMRARYADQLHFLVVRTDTPKTCFSVFGPGSVLGADETLAGIYVAEQGQHEEFRRLVDDGMSRQEAATLYQGCAQKELATYTSWVNGESFGLYINLYNQGGHPVDRSLRLVIGIKEGSIDMLNRADKRLDLYRGKSTGQTVKR